LTPSGSANMSFSFSRVGCSDAASGSECLGVRPAPLPRVAKGHRRCCGHLRPKTPPPSSPAPPLSCQSPARSFTQLSMFRPTLAVLSKASRAPLTSKGGNKEYYKGKSPRIVLPRSPSSVRADSPAHVTRLTGLVLVIRYWIFPWTWAETAGTAWLGWAVQGALPSHEGAHAHLCRTRGPQRDGCKHQSYNISIPLPCSH
jgi:hypothetical protein